MTQPTDTERWQALGRELAKAAETAAQAFADLMKSFTKEENK